MAAADRMEAREWTLSEALAWLLLRSRRALEPETSTSVTVLIVQNRKGVHFDSPTSAWQALADAVASGRLKATGRPGRTHFTRAEREPLNTKDLTLDDHERDAGIYLTPAEGGGRNWYSVEIDRAQLQELFPDDGRPIYRTGSPGRPTSKHVWLPEGRRRLQAGERPASRKAFAADLAHWLTRDHAHAAPTTAKTIYNDAELAALWRNTAPAQKRTA